MEFSSRVKDYYDLYYIANRFDFDGAVLVEALRKTFVNREHHFTARQFEKVMNFVNNSVMQARWEMFIHKINIKTDNYRAVLKTIKNFLEQPFVAAEKNKTFTEHWSAADGKWI